MRPTNIERYGRLLKLSPIEAVRAWIEGSFGVGDEPALIAAIRRDPRVTLSDKKMIQFMTEAMLEEMDPAECLERLAGTAGDRK